MLPGALQRSIERGIVFPGDRLVLAAIDQKQRRQVGPGVLDERRAVHAGQERNALVCLQIGRDAAHPARRFEPGRAGPAKVGVAYDRHARMQGGK